MWGCFQGSAGSEGGGGVTGSHWDARQPGSDCDLSCLSREFRSGIATLRLKLAARGKALWRGLQQALAEERRSPVILLRRRALLTSLLSPLDL